MWCGTEIIWKYVLAHYEADGMETSVSRSCNMSRNGNETELYMIEVFKIITGKYDSLISPHLPLSSSSVTRGNSFKIITRRCHYDLRKYSFCNRITNIWNSLPNDVVNASSLNVFVSA